ncbi:MAG: sulfatase-like hydrolase/transferase, partial [Planctomycetota bacterium]
MKAHFLSRQFPFVFLLALAGSAQADRPNIVFILSDDQGWTDYGFMGHAHVQTPHLDALARQGLLYERGYVTAPLCRPSLASIVTGLYPHQTSVRGNDPVGSLDMLVPHESIV